MTRTLVFVLVALGFVTTQLSAQTSGAPTIASLSSSQTLTEGVDVTLSVSVNGTAPFTYQWRKGGTAIVGATGSTYSLTPVRAADAGTYTVVVTNAVGSVTSGPVVLAVNPAVAPSFYYQPDPVTVIVGDTLNLYAYVNSGTSPLTFTWKKGTTVVATSTTSNSYTKTNVQLADAGSYTVTVSNIAGSVTSSAITVTINPPTAPTISPLSDMTISLGDYLSIYAYVSGSGPITYQWQKDGVAIPGATSYSYYKSGAQASDAGNYALTATNSAGSTTSNTFKVTLRPAVAPTISSISGPTSVVVGDSFSLSVNANGTAPLSFQWHKDGQAIAGATSSYFSKSNAQTSDAGAYTVVVSNAQGSVTSNSMTVAITNARPPIITYQMPSFSLRQGEYLSSISVSVSGTGPFSYQWSKNGTPIPGATGSSLYFSHYATSEDVGAYTVVVTSAQGSATSEPCNISLLPATPPVITTQPVSKTLRQGQAMDLYGNVAASPTATVQWRKDGVAIPGATSSSSYFSYSKNNMASSDAGVYSFIATNSAGSVTSDNATITVIAAGAPRIVGHPASASLLPGSSFYGMFVDARSDLPISFQWYRDGVAVPGEKSSNIRINNAQPSLAGIYTVVATNAAGSVTSREAVITVDSNADRPVITYVQGGRSVMGGESVTVGITTSSSGETVQWFKDGVAIPNATTKEYSFSNFTLASGGTYTAQVTNTSGTFTSRPIVLDLLDAGNAPLVTTQPVGVATTPGRSGSFSVVAEGEAPLTYQWRKDGTAIVGATSSSYYLSNITAANAGTYSVVVTNRVGTATSSTAALIVNSASVVPPVITRHPSSQTVTGSGYLSLNVELLSTAGASYQWSKNGTAIPGATSSSFNSYTINSDTAGRYTVTVTNAAGSVTSYAAAVAVTTASVGPVFTTQPQSIEGYYGGTITFTSAATGTGSVAYQWRKNGTDIPGATKATLTLVNVQSGDVGTYTALATDINGTTPSNGAVLTLQGGAAPAIISQPASVTVLAGTSATFSASVSGTPGPTMQWRKDGADIPGATNLVLNIPAVQASDGGSYTLVARNAVGTATSSAALLTVVYPPPTITAQPVNVNVQSGGTATFSVTASGLPTLSYQWYKNGVLLAGSTASTLTLLNVQSIHAGRYSVTVSTSFGSVTSVDALLTVGNPVSASVPTKVVARAGTPASITANVQSTDPLVFSWAKNGVVIPGATGTTLTFPSVQLTDVGTYSFGVSRPDGTVIFPLTGSAALTCLLTVEIQLPPRITQQPVGVTASIGSTVTLSVRAEDSGPIMYQWQKNGVPLQNPLSDMLVLTNVQLSDAADYRVIAIGANGSTASNTVRVEVTGFPFAGTYYGAFPDGDPWALQVAADGSGVFLALLSSRGQAIVARGFSVSSSGTFTFGAPTSMAAAGAPAFMQRYYMGLVQGEIAGSGIVTGTIQGVNLPLLGNRSEHPVPNAIPGSYQAVPFVSDFGQIDVITAPDGTLLLVAVDATGVRGGRGSVDGNGFFLIRQPSYEFRGQLSAESGRAQGVYAPVGGGEQVLFATPAAAISSERLVNVATRGLAGSGARTLTAGFVISGTSSKEVLIRAVGPGLTGFGVTGVLANPRLRIFKGSTPFMENDDWSLGGFTAQIADAARRAGAFDLATGSADAAVLARLDPGAYTAQVSTDTDTAGVALVEVYDTAALLSGVPRLVNLSTRGEVGRGGDVLIAGIVVGGTAPKKILIRGIGPGLANFGVTGALADPRLKLYQGTTLVRENDNWSDSVDAAYLAATATSVGAFDLAPGSKDAALLVYLVPGSYTAQVSGVGETTGVALVEAYEVP